MRMFLGQEDLSIFGIAPSCLDLTIIKQQAHHFRQMTLRLSPDFTPPSQYNPTYDYASFNHDHSPKLFSHRYKKLQESLPFSKKTKSHKKHFAHNLHEFTNMKYLGGTDNSPKLDSYHDKLDIRDISGATPDYYLNEVFKNRIYGKQVDRQHIFARNPPSPTFQRQEIAVKDVYLPRIDTDVQTYPRPTQLYSSKNDTEFKLNPKPVQYYDESPRLHPVKLNIQHEVMAMQVSPERQARTNVIQRRRIKTELDNPESYLREYPRAQSKELRRWNPTYLTDASNPLLSFLPRIK